MINRSKSAVIYSTNARAVDRAEVWGILNITRETMNKKYLGLPVHVGQSKIEAFAYLKDRVRKRIQGWKEKFLSWAGKQILIKAVAQAIPTFAMRCLDLTKELCDKISTMVCRYWWNQQEGQHKVHWISWEKMMKPKKEGGLGFCDVHVFNLAMLAKQGWRLLQNPDSLCAKVLQAKYYREKTCLEAKPKVGRRSILRGIQLVKKGMIWWVGDGRDLKIWSDPWLPREWSRKPVTPRGRSLIMHVDELVDPITGGWDRELVQDLFWEEDAKLYWHYLFMKTSPIYLLGTMIPRPDSVCGAPIRFVDQT
jgi:hypothetical protein